ncbi:MAG TPA: hypothetical protein P5548_03720 [Candidatus Moranbacteria bacterium]|nr:hypothetical protein [Candidatus Moranbacteria bacterium]HRZ33978.1 hypothetical protein [Candidatus Moranbacteria bacterium]
MVTQELVNYIKQSLILNTPEEAIIKNLLYQGWPESDIKNGLLLAKNQNKEINPAKSYVRSISDKKINPKIIIIIIAIISIIMIGILIWFISRSINKNKGQQDIIFVEDQKTSVRNGQQSAVTQNIPTSSESSNAQNQSAQEKYDEAVKKNMPEVASSLKIYFEKNKTYKDYSLDVNVLSSLGKICDTKIKIDISPDGTKYAVHRNLCSDPSKSFCIENGLDGVLISETSFVERIYHCK